MSNQNPISPVTGKPSALTAMIRRSVGAPAAPSPAQPQQAMAQRGPGGTMPAPGTLPGGQLRGMSVSAAVRNSNLGIFGRIPQQPPQQQQAQVQRGPGGGATAQDIANAVEAAFKKRFDPVLEQLTRAVDQANAQTNAQQQAQVQRAAYETPVSLVARSAVQPGVSTTLPLPQTGPGTVSGGQTVVTTHAPTNPGTAANAMLNEMRYGPMPTPTPMVQQAYVDPRLPVSPVTKQPSLLTAQIRAGMGLPY